MHGFLILVYFPNSLCYEIASMLNHIQTMNPFKQYPSARYFFGALIVLSVLVLNLLYKSLLQNYLPMTLFISPIIIAAWAGGIGPGILATLLGALAESFFFAEPRFSFLEDHSEKMRLIIYLCEGVTLSLIFGELHKSKKRIFESEHKLSAALEREKKSRKNLWNTLENLYISRQQLEKEREAAERMSRVKTLFLANMSHEIRSPLTAILGFTELLKEPYLPEQERNNYIEIIERTGITLTEIINDILDISKVEADRMEIEVLSFSPSQLMADIFSVLHIKCLKKSIQLNFKSIGLIPPFIRTDPLRVRQILLNIIGNAVKFTKTGFVNVTYESRDSALYFTVEDSGIGITKDQQNNLFVNFSQGDSSITRDFAGTGLGLALSLRLAQILHGDVRLLNSIPGQGSTFVVMIPYEQSENFSQWPLQQKIISEEYSAFVGKKILLVDDSEDNQLLIGRILNKYGFLVATAADGQEAILAASSQTYDLILMDMQMPIMDGYQATEELRKNNVVIPIIALTANAMKEDRDKCLSVGCSDYLSKPISTAVLVQSLLKNLKSESQLTL